MSRGKKNKKSKRLRRVARKARNMKMQEVNCPFCEVTLDILGGAISCRCPRCDRYFRVPGTPAADRFNESAMEALKDAVASTVKGECSISGEPMSTSLSTLPRDAPIGYESSVVADENGWARWKPAEPGAGHGDCGGCDARHDPADEDGLLMAFSCPTCEEPGCDECMPMGRGCNCPGCEDAAMEGD